MGAKHRRPIVRIKRAYETPSPDDGVRILVDRVWPRGRARDALALEAWLPEAGPSDALRKWFAHDPARWEEFSRRYRTELVDNPALVTLRAHARRAPLTLVYGARDTRYNQAVVLQELLNTR